MKKSNKPEPEFSLSCFALGLQARLIEIVDRTGIVYNRSHLELLTVLEILKVDLVVPAPATGRVGNQPRDRRPIFRAFVAKAMWNIPTTKQLVERLKLDEGFQVFCGFREVPSESSFSRAFAEFASLGFAERLHEALISRFRGTGLTIQISRDSTAIEAREPAAPKPPKLKGPDMCKRTGQPKKKPGRKKGDPPAEPSRLRKQVTQSWQDAEDELPKVCDVGVKHNSKGRTQYWTGYKFHVDVGEDGMPFSATTTSASLHDTQVAIPLAKKSAERCQAFYTLMDKAYWSKDIAEFHRSIGIEPIVPDKTTRSKKAIPLDFHRQDRFKGRTVVERFFSRLKDNLGASHLRVRGHAKVHTHLMFGLLACAALVVLEHW